MRGPLPHPPLAPRLPPRPPAGQVILPPLAGSAAEQAAVVAGLAGALRGCEGAVGGVLAALVDLALVQVGRRAGWAEERGVMRMGRR
jgi:hypothetical protein